MPQKNTCDIVVLGGANMDYLVRGTALPKPGETVMGEEFQEAPGGKGANQAVAARRLGARAALVARLGADKRGKAIRKRLEEEGVDTRSVSEDKKDSTGVALILVEEGGEKEILTAPGANLRFSMDQIQAATQLIQSAKVLLTQLEIPLEAVIKATRLAHEAGAKVVLDPSPPVSMPDDFLRMVTVIKPNTREAQALTGIAVQDRASARNVARQLLQRGVKAVAVQAGKEGNLIVTGEEEYWFPEVPVQSVDATGAGDAFAATLSVGLLEDRSWQEAGEWASAAAALTTTKLGAQAGLPKRAQVMELVREQH